MQINEKYNQNSNINNYLISAFRILNKKQSEIIKDLKKPQPYVSALMNGKKKVGKEVAKQLSNLYGFDEGKILTGNGEMLNEIGYQNEDFKKLISWIKIFYGVKETDISQQIKVENNYLLNIINGKIPSDDLLLDKLFDHYPDIKEKFTNNPTAILYNQPEVEPTKLEEFTRSPEGKFPKRSKGAESIPVFDVDFLAGKALPMFEDAMQETPAYYMDIPQFSGCEGFRAYSDSMEPKIKSGTILFGQKIDNWLEHLEFGQIYGIVCNDNRRYLKYVKKFNDNSKDFFLLVSENSFYDPFEIPKNNIRSIWLIHGWLNKNT